MSALNCIIQFMASSSRRELTTSFVRKSTLKSDSHSVRRMSDLTELNEHFMVEIPQSARVCLTCRRYRNFNCGHVS
jgi:hypothetical protein